MLHLKCPVLLQLQCKQNNLENDDRIKTDKDTKYGALNKLIRPYFAIFLVTIINTNLNNAMLFNKREIPNKISFSDDLNQ